MYTPGIFAAVSSRTSLLVVGALLGYLLVMKTHPIRDALVDGFLAIRRYKSLWVTLGIFGFANALFQLGLRVYFHLALPPATRPTFAWAREAWRDPQLWLHGSPESVWYLPRPELLAALRESALPALESVAGIFNNLVSTFPLSAIAAVLLLANWGGHHGVLLAALRKRFGHFGFAIHGAILLCALAAIAKPFIYLPQIFKFLGAASDGQWLWYQWAPVIVWLSFLFEYFFGLCIQIYLILLAYMWVRGLGFTHSHLLDLAIRRLSFVVKWAAIVMLLSTVFIDAPLILKNFAPFTQWLADEETLRTRLHWARAALAVFLVLGATLQITLTFHSESLRKALADHARFLARHWWPLAWYLAIAGLHFFLLYFCDQAMRRALGEGTALWVSWTLVFPWLAGAVGAWLLAAWVCLFKQCEKPPRADNDESQMSKPA